MRPAFAKLEDFDTEHTRFASKYSVYLYREVMVDEDTRVTITKAAREIMLTRSRSKVSRYSSYPAMLAATSRCDQLPQRLRYTFTMCCDTTTPP